MPHIPEIVKQQGLIPELSEFLISQGKVGDKYRYPLDASRLVSVRSDRLSVFDFVLPVTVPKKGEVLTALTHFFARQLIEPLDIRHHLSHIFRCNPALELSRKYPFDPKRTLVIDKAKIMPIEFIFRHHLGGSVWSQYEKTGMVAGIKLPPGLQKWQKLQEPFFTPSTKAEQGHDVNITVAEFEKQFGAKGKKAVKMLTRLYKKAYAFAEKRGVLLLDTKFEVGFTPEGEMLLCDEWLTPDSSRFVAVEDYVLAMAEGREPNFLDKQPVRDYMSTIQTPFQKGGVPIVGLKELDPENPEHCAFVDSLVIPEEVIEATVIRYLHIFKLLTGLELEEYQAKHLLAA